MKKQLFLTTLFKTTLFKTTLFKRIYCLYGSKKHMMEQMFQDQSYPFYRFGDLFYLNNISEADWVAYICERF